jgi:hypothetical protein
MLDAIASDELRSSDRRLGGLLLCHGEAVVSEALDETIEFRPLQQCEWRPPTRSHPHETDGAEPLVRSSNGPLGDGFGEPPDHVTLSDRSPSVCQCQRDPRSASGRLLRPRCQRCA